MNHDRDPASPAFIPTPKKKKKKTSTTPCPKSCLIEGGPQLDQAVNWRGQAYYKGVGLARDRVESSLETQAWSELIGLEECLDAWRPT